MKLILTLLCLLASPARAINPYNGTLISTAAGTFTENISGYLKMAGSSTTPSAFTIIFDGPKGGVNASSATLVYGIKATTANITGLVTAGSITVSGTFVGSSSVTASAFYGSGAALTGIPSTASISGVYLPIAGGAMTGSLTMIAPASMTVRGLFLVKRVTTGEHSRFSGPNTGGYTVWDLDGSDLAYVGDGSSLYSGYSTSDFGIKGAGSNLYFGAGSNPGLAINSSQAAIIYGTATVLGDAFSVGASTLVINNGKVGIGQAVDSDARLAVKSRSVNRYNTAFYAVDGSSLGGWYEETDGSGRLILADASGNSDIDFRTTAISNFNTGFGLVFSSASLIINGTAGALSVTTSSVIGTPPAMAVNPSNGFFGIGIASPTTAKMEIVNNFDVQPGILVKNSNNSNRTVFQVGTAAGDPSITANDSANVASMKWAPGDSEHSYLLGLNFGFGTITPTYKVTVASGSIYSQYGIVASSINIGGGTSDAAAMRVREGTDINVLGGARSGVASLWATNDAGSAANLYIQNITGGNLSVGPIVPIAKVQISSADSPSFEALRLLSDNNPRNEGDFVKMTFYMDDKNGTSKQAGAIAARISTMPVSVATSGLDFMTQNAGVVSTGAVLGGDRGWIVTTTAVQTIGAGNTVTADVCGGIKRINSSGAVTTDTTNTFTAGAAWTLGCCMDVVNSGGNNITLDSNANFRSNGAADVVLGTYDTVRVCQYLSAEWVQIGATGNN